MRIFISTIIFFFLYSCQQTTKTNSSLSTTFKSIDNLSALAKLFDNSVIKNNQILWTPGYEDMAAFSNIISNDSLCHTIIDTTLIFDNVHFVIFRTDQYEENIKADCHVCAPIVGIASFEKIGDEFRIKHFKKNVFTTGSFGEYGQLEINSLCVPVFKVKSGWTGTGAEIEHEIYFDLGDFSKLFHITTFSSNGGIYEKSQPNYYETVKKIINKSDSSFVIETTELSYDSIGNKSEIRYKDQVKIFGGECGHDIEIKRL